ncbi:HD-GYP domain-containing protein [Marinagarivorans algicola]|uniref:HD-GYP domain-containing protein n=1 Tax=Marinagarivorans algicola TaxID=1513270 RepID=UPI0037354A0E
MSTVNASMSEFSGGSHSHLTYFAEHLVQFNEHSPVTFKRPVVVNGKAMMRAGQRFDVNVINSLCTGEAPVDYLDAITLARPLSAELMQIDFSALIDDDPAIAEFADRYGDWAELKRCIAQVASMSGLMLQLTVLKQQLPAVYQQALFGAWLGATLMGLLKRGASDVLNIFIAAMSHDIGLLHIPMDYVKSDRHFNYRQLRVLRTHSVVGFYVLKRVASLPDDVLRAVAEHHENLDGTGYPAGKVGNTISRLGQCLIFLDAINAMYIKRLKPGKRPLRDLIPMIQMNGHSRFGVLGKKCIKWLQALPTSQVRAVPDSLMPLLIEAVRERNTYIGGCVDVIDQLAKDVGFRHGDQRVFALQNSIIHINISITQSGIINSAYMRWLDQVETEALTHAYREVEDVFLMMQEVIYHIGKLHDQIELFLSTPCDSDEAFKLKKGLERLERIHQPTPPLHLKALWIANVQ